MNLGLLILDEWFQYNENISTNNIKESDVIWIIAPWMWNRIPKDI